MILRTGVDAIEIERISSAYLRHGEKILARIFTVQELIETERIYSSLAARFAAKEAVSKALGTGIGDIGWHEIEILRGAAGEPQLLLHGKAARLAEELGLSVWSVSLSHTRALAIAFVVASGPSPK
jgi:holo-[acyl-carrier protein] synthase